MTPVCSLRVCGHWWWSSSVYSHHEQHKGDNSLSLSCTLVYLALSFTDFCIFHLCKRSILRKIYPLHNTVSNYIMMRRKTNPPQSFLKSNSCSLFVHCNSLCCSCLHWFQIKTGLHNSAKVWGFTAAILKDKSTTMTI